MLPSAPIIGAAKSPKFRLWSYQHGSLAWGPQVVVINAVDLARRSRIFCFSMVGIYSRNCPEWVIAEQVLHISRKLL